MNNITNIFFSNIFKFLFGFYFYSLIQLDKNISYLPLIKINGKKDKIKVAFKNMDLDNRSMVRNLTIIPLVDLLPYNVRKIIRYRKNDIDKIIKKR